MNLADQILYNFVNEWGNVKGGEGKKKDEGSKTDAKEKEKTLIGKIGVSISLFSLSRKSAVKGTH